MTFGPSTVMVTTYTESGQPDSLGMVAKTPHTTTIPGCRHRTLSVSETAELDINVGTQTWKTTCPPDPVFAALKPDSTITVDGGIYRIVAGPKHHGDFAGPFKVTIVSTRKQG